MGFSEVLRDGLMGEMTERQRGLVVRIFTSGEHLLSLINDILDLSKIEAGKMTLDLEPVHVSSLCASTLSVVREKATSRRIGLVLAVADDLGTTYADTRKVKQIAFNLLSNAVKFSQDGGHVTLRADRVARADVGRPAGSWATRTFALPEGAFADFLQISVTDSGIGISPEGMADLFAPFRQIDSGLARKFEGTGLGLAMVKLLAELHGGTVAVESAVGEGSRFTVWLPFRTVEDAKSAAVSLRPAVCVPANPGGATALVVEDDEKSAELISMHLEAEGFSVLHAASAEAALVLAGRQPLALITVDIMLPNMDGWELLGRIKQIPDLARVPVVIVSIVADRNKGFALGAAAILQKPMSRHELSESLVALGLLPAPEGQGLTVLVIDDDPDAVDVVAVRIAGMAGIVLRAYGGREGIAAARDAGGRHRPRPHDA